jgi:hypothetical protein
LAADTNAASAPFSQQHAFDASAIGQIEQKLFGAIRGLLMSDHIGGPQSEILRQLRSQLLWQVAHRIKALGSAAEQPTVDLLAPKRRIPSFSQPSLYLFGALVQPMGAMIV